jgi:choline dehydrogenase-like flavoprotein
MDEAIVRQSFDGFHQLGGLRMGKDASDGVTDSFGRVFGCSNLYVASCAVFPTSGQANPTFTAVALAIRQAEHIAGVKSN